MSLIDKQLRAAKLQREFAIKIEEQAYKSFNGTRQSARNFREGTLDIGKMGFDNTSEERITKEMITDYHKKEQDNIEKRLAEHQSGLCRGSYTSFRLPIELVFLQTFQTI